MMEIGEQAISTWTLTQDASEPGTLHFAYPRAVGEELSYISPEVKIKLGGRNDDWSAEDRTVSAYVPEELLQSMLPAVSVRVLRDSSTGNPALGPPPKTARGAANRSLKHGEKQKEFIEKLL